MGIVLYAPALGLEAITGMDKNVAIILIGQSFLSLNKFKKI